MTHEMDIIQKLLGNLSFEIKYNKIKQNKIILFIHRNKIRIPKKQTKRKKKNLKYTSQNLGPKSKRDFQVFLQQGWPQQHLIDILSPDPP